MSETRPVPSDPRYLVSDDGRVYSTISGRWLRVDTTWNGYKRVSLGERKRKVHQLVCEAFHGPRPSSDHVPNHKDGDKANNSASNLEWVTKAENRAHASTHGLLKTRATGVGPGKLTQELADEIRSLAGSMSNLAIARHYGISNTMVGLVVNNRAWRARSKAP